MIECVTETRDADGSVIETWSTYPAVQASIEPISGRDYFAAQSTQADVTHRIVLYENRENIVVGQAIDRMAVSEQLLRPYRALKMD